MDDDIDLVLENSPLSDYLESQSLIEEGTSESHSPLFTKQEKYHSNVIKDQPRRNVTVTPSVEKLQFWKKKLCSLFKINKVPHLLSNLCPSESCIRLKEETFGRITTELVSLGKLCEPDEFRIREISSFTFEPCSDTLNLTKISWSWYFLIGLLVSISFATWSPVLMVILVTTSFAVVIPRIIFYHIKRRLSSLYLRAQKFVANELIVAVKCAVGIIREREVLSRGYLMASKHTAVTGTTLKMNACSFAECGGLRRLLVESAQSLIALLMSETATIVKHMSSELQSQRLSIEHLVSKISDEPSNHCPSLETIKVLWQLVHILRSEYLRFCCEAVLLDISVENLFQFSLISQISRNKKRIEQMSAVYDFSKTSAKSSVRRQKSTEKNDFRKLAAHSLCLHLQNALELAMEAEKLVSIPDEQPTELFDRISISVSAAQKCVTELISGNCSVSIEEPKTEDRTENNCEREGPVLTITEDFSPNVVDQVFEAKSDSEDIAKNASESTSSDLDDQKQQKAVSQKVLAELKSVLSVRSETMRMREIKALAHFRGVTVDELLLEEQENEVEQLEESSDQDGGNGMRNTGNTNEEECTSIFAGGSSFLPKGADFARLIASRAEALGRKNEESEVCFGEDSDTNSDPD